MQTKKIISMLLCVLLMLVIVSCNKSGKPSKLMNTMTQRERDSISSGGIGSNIDYSLATIDAFYNGNDFFVTAGINFYLKEILKQLEEQLDEFQSKNGKTDRIGLSIPNPQFDGQKLLDNWEWGTDEEITAIYEFVNEISVYDEEMDFTFIIHVTMPPNYDESKTYPMVLMTDGVWSFGGEHYARRRMMVDGKIEDVLLVSVGYAYEVDGTDSQVRGNVFCKNNKKFLDFLTDNLTPYLNEIYNIDFSRSAIYGASLGATFTHYAAFNSDKYDNQPFQFYIIGSPAFWSPAFLYLAPNANNFKTEYSYFDRKKTFTKELFIVGGENEDPENAAYYTGESVSTLTGIDYLMNRLQQHGVTTAISKIYENGSHSDYLHDMFTDFFLEHYRVK